MDTAGVNLAWSKALIHGLVAAGVSNAVVSPGSRSTPLLMALQAHDGIRVRMQIDERCAGFFALGLARATRRPVVLLSTSGSAPAHWYPAVIEAGQARVPLLLLSADRPSGLQDWGANQTVDQMHLFGQHVRAFHALEAGSDWEGVHLRAAQTVQQSLWPLPGPVHLNIPFQEPLVAEKAPEMPPPRQPIGFAWPSLLPTRDQIRRVAEKLSGGRGLIVCGADHYGLPFAPAVARLADLLDVPVLADPLANLRFGSHPRGNILARYDAFLRSPSIAPSSIQWVLRFGQFPVSKTLSAYLKQADGEHIVVDPWGKWSDPIHRTTEHLHGTPHLVCAALTDERPDPSPRGWLVEFLTEEQRAGKYVDALPAVPEPFEDRLIPALLDALSENTILFCGNSMPIRDLDSFSGGGGKPLTFCANRGASGIDGNISTVLGMAAASDSKRVVGLIGDLAFYHDMNGLLAARGVDATLIVLNNGGGGIFGYLPQAGLEHFEEGWLTPTGLDLAAAARLYRLPFQRVRRMAEFAPALSNAFEQSGVSLIEVIIDRKQSTARHHAYWEAVAGRTDGR